MVRVVRQGRERGLVVPRATSRRWSSPSLHYLTLIPSLRRVPRPFQSHRRKGPDMPDIPGSNRLPDRTSPEHHGAVGEVEKILAAIDGLPPRERERLYLRLLYGRPLPPAASESARATEKEAPHSGPEVRRYLAEAGARPDELLVPPRRPRRTQERPPMEIQIIDLHGRYSVLGPSGHRRMADHLMKIDDWAGHAGSFESLGIRFAVTQRSKEPSPAAKAAFSPRETPVYILDESRVGFEAVSRIMREHNYPEFVPGVQGVRAHAHAEAQWRTHILGITLPTHVSARSSRFAKCIFLKGDGAWSESGGNVTYIMNLIVHELGHAFGVFPMSVVPHPRDSSVMATKVASAAMSAELRPYNRRHAAIIRSTVNYLAVRALVVALALASVACGGTTGARPSVCRSTTTAEQQCQACGAAPSLTPSEELRLAREIFAIALPVDQRARAFYSNSTGPRSYRVNGGTLAIRGVRTAARLEELDAAAVAEPGRDFVFVDIKVLGSSGSDSIYVQATVTERSWMPDDRRFRDDVGRGTYCLQRRGNRVTVTVVTPPIYS